MTPGLIARARSLWRGLRRPGAVGAEITEEFRLHLELRTEDLVRAGLAPAEAARQARREFGSVERYRHEGRASRGLRQFDGMRVSWLDFKLGFRMLARYPGLTLVGGLAIAFAIWVGAGTFELVTQVVRPTLPLPDGGRIVGIRTWDAAANRAEGQVGHDVLAWREVVRSVDDVGAFRTLERNLIADAAGSGEPVEVAEISASAFRVARVPALLGRVLTSEDERAGAPAVVVIGHDVWTRRFGGDPGAVGRTVRLGRAPTTIVGVMPPGFGFPIAQSLWTPLRLDVHAERRQGPRLNVFGRLAPGATLDQAQAELAAIGRRAAAEFPDTHAQLRPQVLPYARSIFDLSGWESLAAAAMNLPVLLLVVLVCANVALLMFARAATREEELVVRSALGASRGRIVTQLFAEALVLGGVAAVVGLAAAGFGLRWVLGVVEAEILDGGRLPFWFSDRLSPTTVLYAGVLTVLGAGIAGVVPALKVTRGLSARLKRATAGGGGLAFGGVWTAVIVAQVAVTVAFPFPVVTYYVRRDAIKIRTVDVGVPPGEYLTLRLEMDRETPEGAEADTSRAAFLARFRRTYQELERRVAADPAVTGVAFAERLPRMYHPHRLAEVDGGGAAPMNPEWPGYRISSASVAPGFFDTFAAPVIAGRAFDAADHAAERGTPGDSTAQGGPVIVNQAFVKLVLGDRNPIGRRVRYTHFEDRSPRKLAEPSAWYEIVGVVRDLGMSIGNGEGDDPKRAGVYHPVAPGGAYPANVGVRVRGEAAEFAPRLRALATAVDPTLRLYDLRPLSQVNDAELQFLSFWFRLLLVVSAMALTLSLAGIYSVMSFTVARRTREIGIRVALGANPWRVVAAVFRRPLAQVALGIAAGATLVGSLLFGGSDYSLSLAQVAAIVAYAAFMMLVCMLACIVPTRRALRVEPTEALRADG